MCKKVKIEQILQKRKLRLEYLAVDSDAKGTTGKSLGIGRRWGLVQLQIQNNLGNSRLLQIEYIILILFGWLLKLYIYLYIF